MRFLNNLVDPRPTDKGAHWTFILDYEQYVSLIELQIATVKIEKFKIVAIESDPTQSI